MAEPDRKSGLFQIQVCFSFDRLFEPKLVQAYDILVPCRERPVGVRVKEFDDEDDGNLRKGFVRAGLSLFHYERGGRLGGLAIIR